MAARKNQIKHNIICFVCLFLVSLYRQLSLHFLPDDPFRTYILYACYVVLLAFWAISLQTRVVQKGIRICLMIEDAIMLCGLTLRFVQDTFWMDHIPLMRTSGLFLAASLLPMALVEFYGAFGIGQADDYRIPKPLWLLSVPIVLLLPATIMDEKHHFFFVILPGEAQPNLNFHPGIGILLIYLIAFLLNMMRCIVIYRRNKLLHEQPFLQILIPFVEPILISLATFQYLLAMLNIAPSLLDYEVIELYAKIYYAGILTWEIYMYLGLVPTNSDYQDIFMHSTVSMQMICEDGTHIVSETAEPISDLILKELLEKGSVATQNDSELHLYSSKDGHFIWNKNTAELVHTIYELEQSAEALKQEGTLLEEELRTRNEEARLHLQNQIYDELASEVGGQLRLMKEIAKKRYVSTDQNELLRKLYLLGTYVKRRCNLHLIRRETGMIHTNDLLLSFQDMISALLLIGIEAEFCQVQTPGYSSEYSIFLFDLFENLLEHSHFQISKAVVSLQTDSATFSFYGTESAPPDIPVSERYNNRLSLFPGGYRLTTWEGGACDVS